MIWVDLVSHDVVQIHDERSYKIFFLWWFSEVIENSGT